MVTGKAAFMVGARTDPAVIGCVILDYYGAICDRIEEHKAVCNDTSLAGRQSVIHSRS